MRAFIVFFFFMSIAAFSETAVLDGGKVAYTAVGKGRTALVLIHGWTCDRSFWDSQVAALRQNYRVIAVDLPGHGASDPAADYTMARFARAVEAVMRREKVPRAVLIGHSMGGAVMLEFARLFPNQIIGIVAVDAVLPDSAAAKGLTSLAARFEGPDALQAREQMVRRMFTEATTPEVRKKIESVMLAARPETALGAMRGLADLSVWKDDGIDLPFIGIAAANNQYISEEGLRKRFPRARLVRVPGTGHFLHMEKPDEVNRIILNWLRQQGW